MLFDDDDGMALGRVVGWVADDMVYIHTYSVARQWLHFKGKDAGVWLTRILHGKNQKN